MAFDIQNIIKLLRQNWMDILANQIKIHKPF